MDSAGQVPANLLSPDKLEQFVQYLVDTPIDLPTTRLLAKIYNRYTATSLTADHWRRIELDKRRFHNA